MMFSNNNLSIKQYIPRSQFLSLGVDQSSINSTSFLTSCWMAQPKAVSYSFLPSIAAVKDGVWRNMTWTNDSIYRYVRLFCHCYRYL